MKKKIIPVVVLAAIIALGVGGWFYFKRTTNTNGRIFVSGNVEATDVDLSFRLSGQIKTLPIEEGDRVKKNQVVATLDTDTLTAQRGMAQAALADARAVLDQLEEGTRSEEIAQARAQWKAAESRMKNARDEYERYKGLFKEGAVSASSYDAKETTYRVAEEEYDNASQRLKEMEVGPREQEIRAARARWERARWDLERIKLDIDHSTLESPLNAVVLVKAAEIGEVTLPGATVATIAAIDEVWLKGYIGEKDLGRVKLGQKVDVTTDSFPGKIYSGVVTFISSRAEFTPKNVQTPAERVKLVYRVKITVANAKMELKPGMPADAEIVLAD